MSRLKNRERSKAKNPHRLPTSDRSTQLLFLARSTETFTTHQISCWNCAGEEEADGGSEADFAREIHGQGWRYVQSDKYQSEGPLCPECAAIPDDQLGD